METGPIKTVFHPHLFKYVGVVNGKWYCDGLTENPSKKCYSGMKAVFDVQKVAQYKCEKGCNITLCKGCIEALTEYTVPAVKTYHPHELHYRISSSQKWYCDGLAEKGTCERGHKKEFLIRSHPFYACLSGCNYMLCDSCTTKYDESKQYQPQKVDIEKTQVIQPRNMRNQKSVEVVETKKVEEKPEEKIKKAATAEPTSLSFSSTDYNKIPLVKQSSLSDDSWIKEHFDELRVIGKGGFGEVYLGKRKDGDKKEYAIKVIETMDVMALNQSIQELMNLSRLKNHPNIMSYENYFMNPVNLANGKVMYQIFIEMELATSSLDKVIEETKAPLPEKLITDIMAQVLTGLRYAHGQNCAHLDLKPENILIVGDKMKIADWGGSLILKSKTSTKLKSKGLAVTQGYVAPEIDSDLYGSQESFNYYLCDVYSLGMLLFRCCGVPVKEIAGIPKNKQKFHDSTIEEFVDDHVKKKNYSKELTDLVVSMTTFDSKKRPSLDQVIETYHKYW